MAIPTGGNSHCRGIINPVANHGHFIVLLQQLLNNGYFILRQQVGSDFIDVGLPSDGLSSSGIISGQHYQFDDAGLF
jgi:hypothetical protein